MVVKCTNTTIIPGNYNLNILSSVGMEVLNDLFKIVSASHEI